MEPFGLKARFEVHTYQVPVPSGDCAILLLVDNYRGQHGRVLVEKAVLVDGGHDGGHGVFGHNAAARIRDTVGNLTQQYTFMYDGVVSDQLKFDSWIVTHWDSDHYRGAVVFFLQDLVQTQTKQQSSYMKYDQNNNPITRLYCPNWSERKVSASKDGEPINAKPHHSILFKDADTDAACKIFIPTGNQVPSGVLKKNQVYGNANNFRQSGPLCWVVEGADNMLGRDLFSGFSIFEDKGVTGTAAWQDETCKAFPVAKAYLELFQKFMHNDPPVLPEYAREYALGVANSTAPLLLCIGVGGLVMAAKCRADYNDTPDNFVSIMTMVMWPPRADGADISLSLYMGGDSTTASERLMAEFVGNRQIKAMKASHHGSRTATSQQALSTFRPSTFIISAGSQYGHPTWHILALLASYVHGEINRQPGDRAVQLKTLCHTTRFPYYLDKTVLKIKDLNITEYTSNRAEYRKKYYKAAGGLGVGEQPPDTLRWLITDDKDPYVTTFLGQDWAEMATIWAMPPPHQALDWFFEREKQATSPWILANAFTRLLRLWLSDISWYTSYGSFELTNIMVTSSPIALHDGLVRRQEVTPIVKQLYNAVAQAGVQWHKPIEDNEALLEFMKQYVAPNISIAADTYGWSAEDLAAALTGPDDNFFGLSAQDLEQLMAETRDIYGDDEPGEGLEMELEPEGEGEGKTGNEDADITVIDTIDWDDLKFWVDSNTATHGLQGAATFLAFAPPVDTIVTTRDESVTANDISDDGQENDSGGEGGGGCGGGGGGGDEKKEIVVSLPVRTRSTRGESSLPALEGTVSLARVSPPPQTEAENNGGLRGICYSKLKDDVAGGRSELHAHCVSGSWADALLLFWPKRTITFAETVSVEDTETFTRLMAPGDAFLNLFRHQFTIKPPAIEGRPEPTAPSDESETRSEVTQASVIGRLLPSQGETGDGVVRAEIHHLLVGIEFGVVPASLRRFNFSTATEAINRQFNLAGNTKNGFELRHGSVVFALDSIDEPKGNPAKELTLADAVALAGLQPTIGTPSLFRAIKLVAAQSESVSVAEHDDKRGAARWGPRNGLWIFPGAGTKTYLRLQFKLAQIDGPGSSLMSLLFGDTMKQKLEDMFKDVKFLITAKRTASWEATLGKVTCNVKSLVMLEAGISLAGVGEGGGEGDVKAYILIKNDGVELILTRQTRAGSLANLFEWLKSLAANTLALFSDIDGFQDSINKAVDAGYSKDQTNETAANKKGKAKADLFWRQLSLTFRDGSIAGVGLSIEAELPIGVAEGQTAGFGLTLGWRPGYWAVRGSFVPGGQPATIDDARKLDPEFEMCQWVPPLDPPDGSTDNRARTLSLLHLDSENSLEPSDVPSYVPTEISAATLGVSSTEVDFSAMLQSANFTPDPDQSAAGTEVPMVAITRSRLGISAKYKLGNQPNKLEFTVAGTLFLPLPPPPKQGAAGGEMGKDDELEADPDLAPQVKATIRYDGSWFFSASAENIGIGSLLSMFGTTSEQADVQEALGHLVLHKLAFRYTYSSTKATDLTFVADIRFKSFLFRLDYTRSTTKTRTDTKDSSAWDLTITFKAAVNDAQLTLSELLAWLLGRSVDDEIPEFLGKTSLDARHFGLSLVLSRKPTTDLANTVTVVAVNLHIGSLSADLVRVRTKPNNTTEPTPAAPPIVVMRVTLNSLPKLPPIPGVGQIDQPFKLELRWLGVDLSASDLELVNSSAECFAKRKLEPEEPETKDSLYKKGCSFQLLSGDTPVVGTKSEPALKKEEEKGKAKPGPPGPVKSRTSSKPEKKPFKKKVNALSVTDVGLDWKAAEKKLLVSFNARAQIGPLEMDLVGFGLSFDFSQCQGLTLEALAKDLKLGIDLNGFGVAMTGASFSAAGFLENTSHMVDVGDGGDGKHKQKLVVGFQGGVAVAFSRYMFTAFGSYTEDDFASFFVFAMLQGTLIKTPYVEITGITGGFGYGSQLRLPGVAELDGFPLLVKVEKGKPIRPMDTFDKFRLSTYITPAQGSLWFAVGISATAMETVDLSAVLTVQLAPDVNEIGLLGSAIANVPHGAPADKTITRIEIDFVGKIDLTHGTFRFDGVIGPRSFILSSDCRPSGGFVICAWFGSKASNPHSGDWCISFGGWHPAYTPPEHYPAPPSRLQIAWRFSDNLAITGQAYAAVTPDALMAGASLSLLFSLGKLSAHFDAHADFIMQLEPLRYQAEVCVSAGISYEAKILFVTKKFEVQLGAVLKLRGPPFSGTAHFHASIFSFDVAFGSNQDLPPSSLTFNQFMDAVQRGYKAAGQPDHVFALEGGAVSVEKKQADEVPAEQDWQVRAADLAFTVMARTPLSSAEVVGSKVGDGQNAVIQGFDPSSPPGIATETAIYARPMQLTETSAGLSSTLKVAIKSRNGGSVVDNFLQQRIDDTVPCSLWGPHVGSNDALLSGGSRPSTRHHLMGVRITPPASTSSHLNPARISIRGLADAGSTFPGAPFPPRSMDLVKPAVANPAFEGVKRHRHKAGTGAATVDAQRALLGSRDAGEAVGELLAAAVAISSSSSSSSIKPRLEGPHKLVARRAPAGQIVPPPNPLASVTRRRTAILSQWASMRGLERGRKPPVTPLAEQGCGADAREDGPHFLSGVARVPLRYALSLERFRHHPPRLVVGGEE